MVAVGEGAALRRGRPSSSAGPIGPLRLEEMDQDIRFCHVDERRLAYATVGDGPLLVFGGGRWVSHLEEEWDDARYRTFVCELARTHRVVRYDRFGVGLSDRELDVAPTNR